MSTLTLARLVYHWAHSTFGNVAADRRERSARIVEEACEVAQADGVDPAMLHAIIDRVYSRPADTANRELGGLLVTVFARCGIDGWDPAEILDREVARVISKPRDHWRGKHDAKVSAGTVTGPSDDGKSEDPPPVFACVCGNYMRAPYTTKTCVNCGGRWMTGSKAKTP